MSPEWDIGFDKGYEWAYKNTHSINVFYKEENGQKVYNAQVQCKTNQHPSELAGSGTHSNGFHEGIMSGRGKYLDERIPGVCKKFNIKYVDYSKAENRNKS